MMVRITMTKLIMWLRKRAHLSGNEFVFLHIDSLSFGSERERYAY
jgi:hypothetical protein